MNSSEGILAAVEAGLGVGFVPYAALKKALQTESVKAVSLANGPIRREFSIVLLNGPEPKGPVGQLLQLLRAHNPGVSQRAGKSQKGAVSTKGTPGQRGRVARVRKAVP
jgi:DNA-binding transcriptional LysR family regulator